MRIGKSAAQVGCALTLCATSILFSAAIGAPLQPAEEAIGGGIGPKLPIPAILNPDGTIPDQYIVTLKELPLGSLPQPLNLEQQIQSLLRSVGGGEVLVVYDTVMSGFAVRLPAAKAKLLAALPAVAAVDPDRVDTLTATQATPPSWGLDRIDQVDLPLDTAFQYPDTQGQGAHIYIMDSGINPNHKEFEGRISKNANDHKWVNAVANNPWDCNGHGTHVASTAAGTKAGVAKKATLHSMRVTDCKGSLNASGVVAAMDWIAKYGQKPAVTNMSFGTTGGRYAPYETAVRGMVNANVAVVVAAGNQNIDACNRSPSAEPNVITVAATNNDDVRGYTAAGYYSNYGSCVDIFAPGTDIVGATHNSNTNGKYMTGTSMAAPHVTGALAIWRGRLPHVSAKDVQNGLLWYHTTPDKVTSAAGSSNRLLYINRAPTAAFGYDCKLTNCTFDATASKDERALKQYQWAFGDGTTATGSSVSHTYAASGTYQVTLTVTDDTAQTGSNTQSVPVGSVASTSPASSSSADSPTSGVSGTAASGAPTSESSTDAASGGSSGEGQTTSVDEGETTMGDDIETDDQVVQLY